eukprot:TRINITY_DN1224_c0_g1_i3.p1 TRINITY_DN1224_c0_g1~~TRINITY_DN1224_c0_g1_i3.p1  ORF type:complete len:143 (-),score=17.87 TRINITY_DN1224_c0_g1_i3:66-494(-)
MRTAGFGLTLLVNSRLIKTSNPEIEKKVGDIAFYSCTARAFKLPLEESSEDFGQTAIYDGAIEGNPHALELASGLVFITGKRTPVSGNVADILAGSRFASHFKVTKRGKHRGPFGATGAATGSSSSSIISDVADKGGKSGCC